MQIHKKIFIVALVLSICISLYFLINPSNILTFPIFVSEFDDTSFKYYMFVKIGIVLLFIKFLLDICLEFIKNWFKNFWYFFTQKSLRQRFVPDSFVSCDLCFIDSTAWGRFRRYWARFLPGCPIGPRVGRYQRCLWRCPDRFAGSAQRWRLVQRLGSALCRGRPVHRYPYEEIPSKSRWWGHCGWWDKGLQIRNQPYFLAHLEK